ncbi:class I SAM-dependent methyltransferase [Rhodoblastus sp.]|uniref:class I SAM-dependent methyltransferase n=1 Tax=Rhodoblastus sp. TaxID=1962975 RepID=UPI003F9A41A8
MHFTERELAEFVHELILGYKPKDDKTIDSIIPHLGSVTWLRSKLMNNLSYERFFQIVKILDFIYSSEDQERKYREQFESFLALPPDREAFLRSIISEYDDSYTNFHRERFFDQLRVFDAIKSTYFPAVPEFRVLDIGLMSVSQLYKRIVPETQLHICDHPAAEEKFRSFPEGYAQFYPINIETTQIQNVYTQLKGQFHLILFCEVLEHLRLEPAEIISDLKELLVPNGMLYLTTPNGMRAGVFLSYFEGRAPAETYSRKNRIRYEHGHIHVREHTMKEVLLATEKAKMVIKQRCIKEYSQPGNFFVTRKISAGGLINIIAGSN